MSDAVEKVIVGQCSGITEKPSGWTEFEIQVPGRQYPTKLATKLEKLIEDARATHGAVATWRFKEQETDRINEKSGKHFVNRYLEEVTLGEAPTAGGSGPEAHHEAMHFADKDRAISRMACLKAAAAAHHGGAGLSEEELKDLPLAITKAAQRFEAWLYRDIDPPPFE